MTFALPDHVRSMLMGLARTATKVFCLLALAAWGGSCGGGGPPAAACMGKVRCACYGNLTCNAGLVCLSDRCVLQGQGGNGGETVTGTGGATVTGTGGAVATGGAGGTAAGSGGMSTGGVAATGGRGGGGGNTTGSGGMSTGGVAATGGQGGSVGSGGQTGSGGTTGGNLIKNGDFSLGYQYWTLTANNTYTVFPSDGTSYCIFNMSGSNYLSVSLGYPMTLSDAFVIEPGAAYTLSYLANAVGATIEVKIGHAEAPYTPLYSITDNPGNSGPVTFTHLVSSSTGDTGAGLVFNVTLVYYSNVCFDDVRLVKN